MKGVALAAIEAAESALDREAEQADKGDDEVQAAIAAARAAARAAVDSLRRGGGSGYEKAGADGAQSAFAARQACVGVFIFRFKWYRTVPVQYSTRYLIVWTRGLRTSGRVHSVGDSRVVFRVLLGPCCLAAGVVGGG